MDATSASDFDELVDELKADVDRTLIRENLKLTPTQRLQRLEDAQRFAEEIRAAGERARRRAK
ncbi:MAG TPA: hypothetical protein VJZ76_10280 [Thermoanaerobaculia bacterium]|nr:hypothetical protein [Thermoanaerobaculia bacterium]